MAWVRHHDKYGEGLLPLSNIAGADRKRG